MPDLHVPDLACDCCSKSRRLRFDAAADPKLLRSGSSAKFDGLGDIIPMYRHAYLVAHKQLASAAGTELTCCRGWREPFMYFDWLWRAWLYLDNPTCAPLSALCSLCTALPDGAVQCVYCRRPTLKMLHTRSLLTSPA